MDTSSDWEGKNETGKKTNEYPFIVDTSSDWGKHVKNIHVQTSGKKKKQLSADFFWRNLQNERGKGCNICKFRGRSNLAKNIYRIGGFAPSLLQNERVSQLCAVTRYYEVYATARRAFTALIHLLHLLHLLCGLPPP